MVLHKGGHLIDISQSTLIKRIMKRVYNKVATIIKAKDILFFLSDL